jgi:hypothetical protein
MRCKECNADLGENYSRCPLCGSVPTDEEPKLKGITTAPFSTDTPVKESGITKAKAVLSKEKIKAIFNL